MTYGGTTLAAAAPERGASGTVSAHEFGGELGSMRRVESGVPRVRTNAAALAHDRWRDGAEAFTHGFAAARGANGTESFTTVRASEDKIGQAHVRLMQSIAGLPVIGADVVVHADARSGRVLGVNGRFAIDRGLDREPQVAADEAIAAAIASYNFAGAKLESAPELTYIIDRRDDVRLAWTILVSYSSENGYELDRVFADAVTGAAIARHPQVRRAKSRQIYNCNNQTAWANCTLMFSEGGSSLDTTAMAAYNRAGTTYDYFSVKHGRDSMDNAGMTIKIGVHYGSSSNTGGWFTVPAPYTAIALGDGNGVKFSALPFSLDVVAHEIAHGVVQYASGLVYTDESGWIDEGLADTFGAATEIYNDGGVNADVWKIADEVYTPGTANDALRYINDPYAQTSPAQHRDYYPNRSFSSDMHINSGIVSLAYYLLIQGGQHPRGQTTFFVTGQGATVADNIFYRALDVYTTSTTNLRQFRDYTLQAATDIYSLNSNQYTAMWNAWAAVGNNWDSRNSTLTSGTSWTSASYTTISTNTHTGQLSGAAGTNHDLYLEKWNGSTWAATNWSTTAGTSTELLESWESAGTYRWRVQATSGTGAYTLYWNRPK